MTGSESSLFQSSKGVAFGGAHWAALIGICVVALTWRLATFNGPLGSDDVVYFIRALDVAQWQWTSSNYNGGLRYGFNIPAGFMLWIFGAGEFQANLWPLLCSVAEIGLVGWFCGTRFGVTVGIFAAILLCFSPLHVAAATRLHADPVAALFLTASFVLFFVSEERRSARLAFGAGMAMGSVFWTKELLTVAIFAFLFWPLVVRRIESRWVFVISGGLVMLVGHLALMAFVAGDPLHAFRVVLAQVGKNFIAEQQGEDVWWYYLKYLLFDIRHTGFLGAFAVMGIWICFREKCRSISGVSLTPIVFWGLSLLAILSLFPVSLSPVRLVMKQSNYLNLFLAAIASFVAVSFVQIDRRFLLVALGLYLPTSMALAMLEQQSYRVFVSNSRALLGYAERNPGDVYLGTANAVALAYIEGLSRGTDELSRRVVHFRKDREVAIPRIPEGGRLIVVSDRLTVAHNRDNVSLESVPQCWRKIDAPDPEVRGLGSWFSVAVLSIGGGLPFVGGAIERALSPLAKPPAADYWEVPDQRLSCE